MVKSHAAPVLNLELHVQVERAASALPKRLERARTRALQLAEEQERKGDVSLADAEMHDAEDSGGGGGSAAPLPRPSRPS